MGYIGGGSVGVSRGGGRGGDLGIGGISRGTYRRDLGRGRGYIRNSRRVLDSI